jgi:HTH-type transcriptional regulator, sugar sensing transcriptional regulator
VLDLHCPSSPRRSVLGLTEAAPPSEFTLIPDRTGATVAWVLAAGGSRMNETSAVRNLVELGMNEREARLYVGLLRTREATPALLHRITAVPRTKIYETLDRMVSAGYCSERQEGRHRFFRATRPAEVYTLLRNGWNLDLQMKCAIGEGAFARLDKLFVNTSAADPSFERIEVIRSKDQINAKFLALMAGTRGEVLSFTRSPYAAADAQTRARVMEVQKEAFARGVRIRTIYMVETQDWDWLGTFIADLERAGEQVRLTADLPMKMFIFDQETVLIALPSVPGLTGADFTMLAVSDPGFTRANVVLFETCWEGARTLAAWNADRGPETALAEPR